MAHFAKDLNATDGQGNVLDPTQWSSNIFTNATANTMTNAIAGPVGSMKSIIMDQRLSAEPGSTVRYTFNPFTDDRAILGSETSVKANAKTFEEHGLKVEIHPVTHAKASKGVMTQQRTIWNIRETSRVHLTELNRTYLERIRFATLQGITYTELEDVTKPHLDAGNTDPRVTGDGRCLVAQGSSSSAFVDGSDSDNDAIISTGITLATTDILNTKMIEEAATAARKQFSTQYPYKMTPLTRMENGDPVFILYVGLYSWRRLKEDPMFEKYALAKLPAALDNDQYAKGADAMWDNVIIKRTEFIEQVGTAAAQFERNLLVGAEAMVELYGNMQADYTEEFDDHNRFFSAATTTIRGESKVTFNGQDVNVMQLIGAAN